MVSKLEQKYGQQIKTVLDNNNPYTQVQDLTPKKVLQPNVNTYNNQSNELKPLPKADFKPLVDNTKFFAEKGIIQPAKQTIRNIANLPSAITYANKKVQDSSGFTQENKSFYEQQTENDLDRYKSVQQSMESMYDYDYMPENTKNAYQETVNTVISRESYGETFEEQRQIIQNMYQDKPLPDFVQKRIENINSKETEYNLKLENARQNLLELAQKNASEIQGIEEKYKDSEIGQATRFSSDIMGSIVQMSPYIAVSAITGGLGGATLGSIAGTGTMYATVYTSSMSKALSEGATREQATDYAHMSALIEAGTELISGGIPGAPKGLLSTGIQGKIDDAVKVAVKDGTFRKFISTGVDVFGEGFEEMAAEYLGSMALSIYTEDERTMGELNADAVKAFIMGSVTSGTLQLAKYQTLKVAEKFVTEKSVDIQSLSIEEANKLMNQIALRTGVTSFDGLSYRLEDMPKGQNGYIVNGKEIVLNKAKVEESGLIESALPHEMTHALERVKGYQDLANFVMNLKAQSVGMDLAQLQEVYQEKYNEIHEQELTNGNTSHQLEIATQDKMARELVAEFIKNNIASRPYKNANGEIQLDSNGNIITYRDYNALLKLASNQPNAIDKIKKVIRSFIRKGQIAEAQEFDETDKANFLMMQEYLENMDSYLSKVLENADKGLFITETQQGVQFDTKVLSPMTEQGVKVIRAYESENGLYNGTREDAEKLLAYSARKGLGFNEVQTNEGILVRDNNIQLPLDQLQDVDLNELKNVVVNIENKSQKYMGMSKDNLWKERYRVLEEMDSIKGGMFSKETREAREPFNEEITRIDFAMQGKNYDDMFKSYDEYLNYISNEREIAKKEWSVKEEKRRQEELDRINSLVKMNKKDILMSDENIELFIEENELNTTKDVNQAIFIFRNGTMINGDFSGGTRGADHQVLSNLFEYSNNYPKIEGVSLWGNIHLQTGVVRIVPETNVALIMEGQELTKEQQDILNNSDYKVEEYLPLVKDEILVNKPNKQYSLDNTLLSRLNISTLIPLIQQSKQSASDYINSLNIQSDNPNVARYLETMSNFIRDYNPELRTDSLGNLTTQKQEDANPLKENGKLKVFYTSGEPFNQEAINYGHILTSNPLDLDNPTKVYAVLKKPLYDITEGSMQDLNFELGKDIQKVIDAFNEKGNNLVLDTDELTNAEILKAIGDDLGSVEKIKEFYQTLKEVTGYDGMEMPSSRQIILFNDEQIVSTDIKTDLSQETLKEVKTINFKKSGNSYIVRLTNFNGTEQILVQSKEDILEVIGNDFAKVILGNATNQEQSYDVVDNILAKPLVKSQQGVFSIERDDHDNQLTEEVVKFNKESSIKQKDGTLKVMYHGSPFVFEEFSYLNLGSTGVQEGTGIYFTDSSLQASQYRKDGEGMIYEVYLNIKNPTNRTKKTITSEQLKQIVLDIHNTEDNEFLYNYGDINREGLDKIANKAVSMILDANKNDVDIIDTVLNDSRVETEQGLRTVTQYTNIDGYTLTTSEGTVAIAFFPEQIKSINNPNPTNDRRIQYSIELDSVKNQQIEQAKSNSTANVNEAKAILNDGTLTTSDSVPLESVLLNPLYNQAIVNKMPTQAQKEQLQAFYLDTLARSGDTIYLELHNNDKVVYLKYPVVSDLSRIDSDIAKFYQDDSQQQEFFKDSKVRDKDGNLEIMYHGTPDGSFTKFKSGTYFTSNKEYADKYQNTGASSISTNKVVNNPKTYEVYLNITKPFDTRNPKERKIFETEYYKKYGMGSPLTEKGLPDWLDGMDLQEFLEEQGYDYDGLILDEGATGGYGEDVASRGISYVVFNPNQIKETTNLTPTLSPDIRYSIDDERIATRSFQESVLKTELSKKTSQSIEKDIANGTFNYVVVGDEQSIRRGLEEIGDDVEKAYAKIKSTFDSGKRMSKDDLVVAQLVLKKLEKTRQTDKVVDLIQNIAILGTELGQQVQALSLIKRMTPEGKLITLQKTLTKLQDSVNSTKGRNAPRVQLEIPKEYQEFFVEASARVQELEEQRVELGSKIEELTQIENEIDSLLLSNVGSEIDNLSRDLNELRALDKEEQRLLSLVENLQNKASTLSNEDIDILQEDINILKEQIITKQGSLNEIKQKQAKLSRLESQLAKVKSGESLFIDYSIEDSQSQIKEYQNRINEINKQKRKFNNLESTLVKLSGIDPNIVAELNAKVKVVRKAERLLKKLIKENERFTSTENVDSVLDEVKTNIAEQLPVTWVDKVNAWRYLSMLGNPRTHVRNFLGNAFVMPMSFMRDVISVGMQQFIPEEQRTRVLFASKDAIDYAKLDYQNMVKELIEGTQKYDTQTDIQRRRKIFNNKPSKFAFMNPINDALEWVKDYNYKALAKEDEIYVGKHYVAQMSKYLTAQKIDLNSITDEQLENARTFAIKEAKKMTFKQNSKLVDSLNSLARQGTAQKLVIDATVPFKLTPVNVLKMGVEYSPLGLANGVAKLGYDVRKGKVTAAQAIDMVSAGLTGTGIALVGMWFYSMGFIELGGDDDETKRVYNYKNSIGRQNYSLKFGDSSYTIDWIAPAIMPFIMGAEFARALEKDNDVSWVDAIYDASLRILDPIFELSMLQGVTDTLQSFSGNGTEMFVETAKSMAANYANQFIPTLLGQISRTIDPIQRSTLSNNKGIVGDLETIARKMLNKTPLSFMNAPVIDVKGNPISSDENPFMRAFMNLVSPGYYKTDKTNDIDREILRLYELTENTNVIPKATPKSFTRTEYQDEIKESVKYDLGNKDYSDWGITMGKESYELLGDLSRYDLDDESKIKVMSLIYEYAYEKAKDEYLKKQGKKNEDDLYVGVFNAQLKGISITDYLIAKYKFSTMSGEGKKESFNQYLNSNGLSSDLMELVGGYKSSWTPELKTKGLKKLK